jgi:hypothetical protein
MTWSVGGELVEMNGERGGRQLGMRATLMAEEEAVARDSEEGVGNAK